MFSFAQAFRTVSTSEAKNQLKVPWTFALRVFWSQQTSIFRKEKYRPYHYGAGILLAGATWYIAYDYFTDHIDRSSLLVRQTLFNIKCSDVLTGLLGSGIRIQSRLQGYQSQQKGFADVRFSIVGSSGLLAQVHVIADKKGWDWNTKYLQVTPKDRPSIVLYDSRASPAQ